MIINACETEKENGVEETWKRGESARWGLEKEKGDNTAFTAAILITFLNLELKPTCTLYTQRERANNNGITVSEVMLS